MGLSLLPPAGERLWTLNAVRVPAGVDEAAVRKTLLDAFNIEVGAGLGPLAGRIWRVGLMGASSIAADAAAVPRRRWRRRSRPMAPRAAGCGRAAAAGGARGHG